MLHAPRLSHSPPAPIEGSAYVQAFCMLHTIIVTKFKRGLHGLAPVISIIYPQRLRRRYVTAFRGRGEIGKRSHEDFSKVAIVIFILMSSSSSSSSSSTHVRLGSGCGGYDKEVGQGTALEQEV